MEEKSAGGKQKLKHITIETPCTVAQLESLLQVVSSQGHWHDASISALEGKIAIGYDDDEDNDEEDVIKVKKAAEKSAKKVRK